MPIFDTDKPRVLNYEPSCCGKPMRDMGEWPKLVTSCCEYTDEKGHTNIGLTGTSLVMLHQFHCKECDSYIGIGWMNQDVQRR